MTHQKYKDAVRLETAAYRLQCDPALLARAAISRELDTVIVQGRHYVTIPEAKRFLAEKQLDAFGPTPIVKKAPARKLPSGNLKF